MPGRALGANVSFLFSPIILYLPKQETVIRFPSSWIGKTQLLKMDRFQLPGKLTWAHLADGALCMRAYCI